MKQYISISVTIILTFFIQQTIAGETLLQCNGNETHVNKDKSKGSSAQTENRSFLYFVDFTIGTLRDDLFAERKVEIYAGKITENQGLSGLNLIIAHSTIDIDRTTGTFQAMFTLASLGCV